MKIYFLHRSQQFLGPFTLDEIRSQSLEKDDIIWKDGEDEMVRAEQLEEFACMFNTVDMASLTTVPKKINAYLDRVLINWLR